MTCHISASKYSFVTYCTEPLMELNTETAKPAPTKKRKRRNSNVDDRERELYELQKDFESEDKSNE